MKPTVWFHAPFNELVIKVSRNKVERKCQGTYCKAIDSWIPDYLHFSYWKWNMKKAKQHMKKGWLIKLGYL